jgi:hypothetical protein
MIFFTFQDSILHDVLQNDGRNRGRHLIIVRHLTSQIVEHFEIVEHLKSPTFNNRSHTSDISNCRTFLNCRIFDIDRHLKLTDIKNRRVFNNPQTFKIVAH